jgi:hypothetical protein
MHAAPGRTRADAAPILARAVLRKYQQYKFAGIGPFAWADPCLTLWRARPPSGKSEA